MAIPEIQLWTHLDKGKGTGKQIHAICCDVTKGTALSLAYSFDQTWQKSLNVNSLYLAPIIDDKIQIKYVVLHI